MYLNGDYLNKTDEELVVLTLKDKENYQYLIQRYKNKLMRYIVRLSGIKTEDAEGILQEVFIRVYQKLNDFDTSLKFSSWIYRITHNEIIDHLRKSKTRPQVIDSESNLIALDLLKADLDIIKDIDKKYFAENIEKIINTLDEKYRNVIILKYKEDKDYNEISDILKKPPGTIATLLKRAKEQLKKEILKNSSLLQNYV